MWDKVSDRNKSCDRGKEREMGIYVNADEVHALKYVGSWIWERTQEVSVWSVEVFNLVN